MFNNLTKFDYIRTKKEALGFYLAYVFFGAILGASAAMVFVDKNIDPEQSFKAGQEIGIIIAPFYCLAIGILMLRARKKREFKHIALVLSTIPLGYFGGALLGLIPLAYISTQEE